MSAPSPAASWCRSPGGSPRSSPRSSTPCMPPPPAADASPGRLRPRATSSRCRPSPWADALARTPCWVRSCVMPTQREDTMQPDVIGDRYHVERAIGQGGMGTVWLCRDESLRRQVAVKQVGLLPGETATDSARAFREARSSAALSHRNVVTVFDVVEEAGAIWLV